MSTDKKYNVLFIADEKSMFDKETQAFNQLFHKVDKTLGREESLKYFDKNQYDIVICDLSVDPKEIAFMQQLKHIKPQQTIFVLVDEKDTDKVYGFADLRVNPFILSPDQFDEALAEMARFNIDQEK